MKNFILKKYIPLILMAFLAMGRIGVVSAQTTSDDGRYNLAVYATGTQNDQSLPASLQTIIQNRTDTKLTEDGNYRLIERSGEFVRQIQKEQLLTMGDKHLQKSYHYYINGETQTATLNFHPYVGGNHPFGAGPTLQF